MSHVARKVLMLLENSYYVNDMRPKREARTLLEAGYRVSVICPHASRKPFHRDIDGVQVFAFPVLRHNGGVVGYVLEYGYSFVVMFILSLWVWFREGIDIIHAHNPPDIFFAIAAFFKIFGKKFVFDHHDLTPELYVTRMGHRPNDLVYKLLVWAERCSCRLADHVLATNDSYREIEIARAGVPDSKVFVVRNAPDQDISLMNPAPELQRPTDFTIAYVGAIGPQDGLDYLVRALHHLLVDLNRPDFYCAIIGDGPSRKKAEALAKELGLENHIWFVGWVGDRQRVLSYLSAADLCVQPDPSSPLNDVSTMVKTMEYMALGKPVVAFDLPETRCTGGDLILYAQPNDEKDFARQIARLMDDGELRRKLGEQGRQRIADNFTWEHSAANLLRVYETLEF